MEERKLSLKVARCNNLCCVNFEVVDPKGHPLDPVEAVERFYREISVIRDAMKSYVKAAEGKNQEGHLM